MMLSSAAAASMISGGRSATINGLNPIKCPEEQGTKKEYEECLEIIEKEVSLSWPFGQDIAYLLREDGIETVLKPPPKPDSKKAEEWETQVWNNDILAFGLRRNAMKENKMALFSLLMGNLSNMMKSKITSRKGFVKADIEKDVVWLLEALDEVMLNYEQIKHPIMARDDQMERIMRMRQREGESNKDFVKQMMREVKVYKKYGGKSFLWSEEQDKEVESRMKEETKGLSSEEKSIKKKLIKKEIEDKITSMVILKRTDKKRYGNLQIKYHNRYLMGENKYPESSSEVLKILDNYKQEWNGNRPPPKTNGTQKVSSTTNGASFLQTEKGTKIQYLKGTNGSFHPRVTCHGCGIKGHYKSHCPVCIDDQGTTTEHHQESESEDKTEKEEGAVSEVHIGTIMNQGIQTHINPRWILLDSESTNHTFCNKDLVTDIRKTNDGEMLRMYSNGGFMDTNEKANFGSIEVWYNKDGMANILSLAEISESYRVTLDTEVENAMILHLYGGKTMKFERVDEGLYVFDASDLSSYKLMNAFTFLSTVDYNKQLYKARDVRKADEAIVLHRRTNHMAKDKFVRVIQQNLIRNCPLTVGDVRRSNKIYGPALPTIKGRTRYRESSRVPDQDIIQIPKDLYEDLKRVTLCIDFHFVNNVTVFHTISRRLNYRTVAFPMSRTKYSILKEIQEVQRKYHSRGFQIIDIHADKEFEKVRSLLYPVRLTCCGVDDHVPEVERSVQTQKNENRAVCHAMPYRCLPRVMIRAIVRQGNEFLNAFGSEDSYGPGLTPRNIIDNLPHVDYNHLQYELGEYVQLHVTENVTNTMKSRTIGAIVLDPQNITGTYNFMSLETGREVNGRVVAQLPITKDVIERVEYLGKTQDQPFLTSRTLQYEWKPGSIIDDINVEEESTRNMSDPEFHEVIDPFPTVLDFPHPSGSEGADEMGDESQTHKDGQTEEQNRRDVSNTDEEERETEIEEKEDIEQVSEQDRETDDERELIKEEESEVEIVFEEEERTNNLFDDIMTSEEREDRKLSKRETEIETQEKSDSEGSNNSDGDQGAIARREEEKERRRSHWDINIGSKYGRGRRKRNKRERYGFTQRKRNEKKRSYSFLQKKFKNLNEQEQNDFVKTAWEHLKAGESKLMERFTTGMVFAAMTAKKGIEKYGKEAEMKLIAEFTQLLEYQVFHGRKAEDLNEVQKKKAANMINIIEEKINRGHTPENPVLRARSVFNGRVQRGLYTKEQTTSPTVSLDAFLLTSMVDVMEKRDVAITDIKGAYLNAKMKEEVIMKITGPEVRIFCNLDKSLNEFVVLEKGKEVLYVQLDKALYGCVQSALLWYELYSSTLEKMGFKLNPYDLCVANCEIQGKICTICWYVDDNKISHEETSVVDEVISKIESKFGEMSKTRGKKHSFLGMEMELRDGMIIISMKKHIDKAIEEFKGEVNRTATTPAKGYLFEVRENAEKLDSEMADNFHSVVASLLFISRRCRLDIQTAVAFLTTRVSDPDVDDWSKLRRVLQYLKGTKDLSLKLGCKDMSKMESWVDASYGVHVDCRSHTGGCISFGRGVIATKCQKQKLNVRSSTEGEIVGVSDFFPNMIWVRMFMGEQGFHFERNVLYQDNQSAMKIEINGKRSSSSKTKHMDNRYFWIKDRLETENIQVVYCPTEKMIGDFFTKPLQGNLFKRLREVVMGVVSIEEFQNESETKSKQERVRGQIGTNSEEVLDVGQSVVQDTKRVTWKDIDTEWVARNNPEKTRFHSSGHSIDGIPPMEKANSQSICGRNEQERKGR